MGLCLAHCPKNLIFEASDFRTAKLQYCLDSMRREDRINQLKGFLEKEPDSSFLRYALAMEYGNSGKLPEAVKILELLQKDDPSYTATYYHLAAYLIEMQEGAKAEEVFKKGIDMCRKEKAQHHLSELQSAYNNFLYDDE
jgi:tetratricopeptide (TPR) repeat protein